MSAQAVNPVLTQTFEQENTTLAKYRLAKKGTDNGQVVAATDHTAYIYGATLEDADSIAGHNCTVVLLGLAYVVISDGTASAGAAICATTGGKGIVTTTDNHLCAGYLMYDTTAADEEGVVMINPFMYGTI